MAVVVRGGPAASCTAALPPRPAFSWSHAPCRFLNVPSLPPAKRPRMRDQLPPFSAASTPFYDEADDALTPYLRTYAGTPTQPNPFCVPGTRLAQAPDEFAVRALVHVVGSAEAGWVKVAHYPLGSCRVRFAPRQSVLALALFFRILSDTLDDGEDAVAQALADGTTPPPYPVRTADKRAQGWLQVYAWRLSLNGVEFFDPTDCRYASASSARDEAAWAAAVALAPRPAPGSDWTPQMLPLFRTLHARRQLEQFAALLALVEAQGLAVNELTVRYSPFLVAHAADGGGVLELNRWALHYLITPTQLDSHYAKLEAARRAQVAAGTLPESDESV